MPETIAAGKVEGADAGVQSGGAEAAAGGELDGAVALERRRARLLAAWGEGKRLADPDLALIADLLPASARPGAARDGSDGEIESGALRGAGGGGYLKPLKDYAGGYETTPASITRWVKLGKRKGQECPLDEPGRMAAWWRATHRNAPGEVLVRLEREASQERRLEASGAIAAAARTMAPVTGTGIDRAVNQAEQVVALAWDRFDEAVRSGDLEEESRRKAEWLKAVEQLRRFQATAPKVNAAAGEVLAKSELRPALAQVHTNLAALVMGALVAVYRKAAPEASEAEAREVCEEERRRLFVGLDVEALVG